MSFVPYYTRVSFQFVLFIFTKIIILRGQRATPYIRFTRSSYLIAANHRSGLDPFVIVSSLRIRDFFQLAPFSFMTSNKFIQPPLLRPFAWAAGCFPAKPGLGAHGIEKALSDLNDGYTVMIFPEGKRIKGIPEPPKRGVSVVLEQSPKTRIILSHIEWRTRYSVRSIRLSSPVDRSHLATPEAIMQAIYKL